MALKFRLRGLAETFVDSFSCPSCGNSGTDDTHFSTEFTRVTLEGIIVTLQCQGCGEIFVPTTQRVGVLNPSELKKAVEKDSVDSGEPIINGIVSAKLVAERLNAQRRGDLH